MFKGFVVLAAVAAVTYGVAIPDTRSDAVLQDDPNVLYYVYDRQNYRDPIQIFTNDHSVVTAPIQFREKVAVVVHGHEASAFDSLNPTVKDAFIESEDVTVIVVDWSFYAGQKYSEAVEATPHVGYSLAHLLRLMEYYRRISLDNTHLVGFNLGAHLVGFTGRALNGRVARITGLDPAASRWGSDSERIRASDAVYVEVIHTDGGGLTGNGIGEAAGHVDFFANGGSSQPGCLTHACSNNRAWQFFAATLTHNHLIGNKCETSLQITLNRCRGYTLQMGNNELYKFGSGSFRANTGRWYPF